MSYPRLTAVLLLLPALTGGLSAAALELKVMSYNIRFASTQQPIA